MVGLVPGIGFVKNIDEAAGLVKNVIKNSDLAEHTAKNVLDKVDEFMPALKHSMDSPSIAPLLGNAMKSSDEVAQGTGRNLSNKKRILLDVIALLPAIGDIKYINKFNKLGNLSNDLNIVDDASDAFKNADEVGDGIADASKRTEKAERPSWRQSEKDAAKDYPNYEAQVSYKKMDDDTIQKVSYGTKGSVRPDYYKNGYSVDIKNYNVTTFNGRNNLIRNIEKQFQQRMQNLPINTKQTVVIDIRGQDLTNEILDSLYDDIIKRIRDIDIIIKTN